MRDTFERDGFVRLPGAFTRAEADAMCDRFWKVLAELHGIRRDAPETWTLIQPRHLQRLTKSGAFDAMAAPSVVEAVSSLVGADTWARPRHWGSALVIFPRAGATWDLPHAQWHMDWPARGGPDATLGVRLFAYANATPPGAGGTCVLAGSHRLVSQLVASGRSGDGSSPRVKRRLFEHPWLQALTSPDESVDRAARFMRDEAVIDGIPVRVVELTGEPGDVVLMHPWLFHAVAPNCSPAPRLLVGHAVHTSDGLAVFAAPKKTSATVPS